MGKELRISWSYRKIKAVEVVKRLEHIHYLQLLKLTLLGTNMESGKSF